MRYLALLLALWFALPVWAQNGPAPQGGFPQTGGGVTKITAGTGISLSPSGGTGNVTVTNSSPSSGGTVTSVASGNLSPLFTSSVSGSTGAASITYSLSNAGADTLFGNNSGSSGAPSYLTVAQVNAILPVFTSLLNGSVPLSGGGTTNYLRADGNWAAPPGTAGSGTITSSTIGQVPVYTGATTVAGGTGLTYASNA